MTHMADDLPGTTTTSPRDRSEKVERARLARQEIFGLLSLLIFGVSLRLVRISRPFVEEWAWREADVGDDRRELYRNGFKISIRRSTGRQCSRVVAASSRWFRSSPPWAISLFGVHEWVGRAVSVSFACRCPSSTCSFGRLQQESAAFAACIYVLVPLSIFQQPVLHVRLASLSFSIVALYVFSECWTRSRIGGSSRGRWRRRVWRFS